MDYVFEPMATPSVPVNGRSERFPVRRIFCIGQNYAAHAREMGSDPTKQPPVFFTKPADAVVTDGRDAAYPSETTDLHHEIELIVALKSGGRNIAEGDAKGHVFGYAAGVDLTRRDLQLNAKKAGMPWDVAKGFDDSAVVGTIATVEAVGHPEANRIWLSVNGDARQDANTSDLIWSIPATIATLSRFFELKAGDLIYTGTPEGVGPVAQGERITGGVEGVGELDFALI